MKLLLAFSMAVVASAHSFVPPSANDPEAYVYKLIAMNKTDPAGLAKMMAESPMAAKIEWKSVAKAGNKGTMPVVMGHGMGDSCFNSGMKEITTDVGKHLGVYSVCVPTGNSQIMDTIDGFLKNMDRSIDDFAKKIKADPKLASGFDCVGFSQGNSLCRGYIQKYNGASGYPTVRNFMSVHGTVMGTSGFPQCNPAGILSPICAGLSKFLGELAYNPLSQGVLFQADYFRDPNKLTDASYLSHSQLAQLNNEGAVTDSYKTNFLMTKQYVMVKAMGDTMIFPNEGEHWGCFAPGSFKKVLMMNETRMYTEDLFGLKTADQAGRIHFETTKGNHLQFTEKQLFGWLDKYF